ncbi:MAG: tetratricopeptide repeat protein [Magnetococcales bacterium]|nr:tetratricopeptide repeat protein [Magnetococcales bacterium]
MAQIDDIFEQIDEKMDEDAAQKFWRDNQKYIIAALVLLFIGLFAYVGWRDARIKEDYALSDAYIQAQALDAQGDRAGASAAFQKLLDDGGDHGYALLAILADAQALARVGKIDEAVARFETLAAKTTNSPLQGLALLNAAYLTAADSSRSRGFLSKIAETSPFRPHALELDGLLLSEAGDEKNALAKYQEAVQSGASGPLLQRLNQRLERLAVKR